eukprot:UN01062
MNFKSDPKEEAIMVKDEDLKLEHNADNVVSDTISNQRILLRLSYNRTVRKLMKINEKIDKIHL